MVKSPCINVCRIDPKLQHCIGCQRTLEEIEVWSVLTDEEKQEVLNKLPARMVV